MAASSCAAILPDPVRPFPDGGIVLAVVGERADDSSAAVLAAAAGLARTAAADIVLFRVPRGGEPRAANPRCVVRLLRSTRGTTCRIDVWRSWRSGASGMADAVAGTGADLVLLPADRDTCGERTIRRTLAYYATRVGVPVVAVDRDGALSSVLPLEPRPARPRALRPGGAARPPRVGPRVAALAWVAR